MMEQTEAGREQCLAAMAYKIIAESSIAPLPAGYILASVQDIFWM